MHMLTFTALVVLVAAGAPGGSQGKAVEAVDALDGLDPVLLVGGKEVPGKSAFSVTRGEFIYLFSTADSKAAFEREPTRYEIQLGGMCARMGKTAGGNPADFVVHEGKIYIFGSDDCHKKFQAEPAKYGDTDLRFERRLRRRAVCGDRRRERGHHLARPQRLAINAHRRRRQAADPR